MRFLRALSGFFRRHWLIPAFLALVALLASSTDVFERYIVYFPIRELAGCPADLGMQYRDAIFAAEDGVRLHGWFVPRPGARHTFLILHGNGGNISHRLGWMCVLHDLGAHVLIFDYRGYGKSQGRPAEKGLYRDALAAYRWWSNECPEGQGALVLVGESLGGAVAVHLAANVQVEGLILQSTFTSAWDMAKTILPLGLLQPLTVIRFDSASAIARVRCPKLFIHGTRDDIVPFRLGRRLYELAPPPKEFYEVRGAGHNDVIEIAGMEYAKRIKSFLSSLGQPQ